MSLRRIGRGWAGLARSMRAALVLAALVLAVPGSFFLTGTVQAEQAIPALSGRIVDAAQSLSPADRAKLDAQLAAVEAGTGSQLVILTVQTTQPEDIAAYANRVANTWKIGRKEVGDGVLLIVAMQDRRLRIEVAKTLEGAIPDLAARRVIDEALTPALRRGDLAGGLAAAVDRLDSLIRQENLPAPEKPPATAGPQATSAGDDDIGTLALIAAAIGAVIGRGVSSSGRKERVGAITAVVSAGAIGAMFSAGLAGVGIAAFTGLVMFVLAPGIADVVGTLLQANTSSGGSIGSASSRGGNHGWSSQDWSSGSSRGSSGGGGFSSGGGGDFGGGGASGSW